MKVLLLFLLTLNAFAAFNPFPATPVEPGTLSSKGQLLGHNGSVDTLFNACANGESLEWDSTESLGFKCVTITIPAAAATVTKTANYTLATTGDENVIADATTASFTLTLPTAVGNSGLSYRIVKSNATNGVVVDGNGAELVNGVTSISLVNIHESVIVVSDGTGWYTVAENLKEECQLKTLPASSSSIGTILTFSNLVVGDIYTARAQIFGNAGAEHQILNNGVNLGAGILGSTGTQIDYISSGTFEAAATTTLLHKVNTNTTIGNGTRGQTWMELCHHPNRVETTKF